jgi:hypothetical protein
MYNRWGMPKSEDSFLIRFNMSVFEDVTVLGAGSYGLVASNTRNEAVKLFYDLRDHESIQKEAALQQEARRLLLGIVAVPAIHEVLTQPQEFHGQRYLNGIVMDRIPIVEGMPSATHILLGYHQDDIDTEWPRDCRRPLAEDNPTRGFHAGSEMMEAIWSDEGRTDISIESVAYTMGNALIALIRGGIVPWDLEWIYGGGKVHLIDFGLCDWGHVDPGRYLASVGSWGLGGDYYIPHKGDRGYEAFMEGWNTFN